MKYLKPLIIFIAGWLILVSSNLFASLAMINIFVQLLLFSIVVFWPIFKTGRLSYVDIGWPWGLVCIGLIILVLGKGYYLRVWAIGLVYIMIGFRMGFGVLRLWQKGYLQKEFPRYQYQRKRWSRSGKTNTLLAMMVDALAQCLANASFLAFPAFIIASNREPVFNISEIIGAIIWMLAFILESVADTQKLKFIRKMSSLKLKSKVCEVGLWKYTRHPNYFAEWMVWNALIVASVPSWLLLNDGKEYLITWILLGLGLLFVSRIMYLSLVYLTGAVPSEYYSLRKRPEYESYTNRVNMFFPGLPKP